MSRGDRTPKHIRLDERNHVEKPLLNQLAGLGWEVLDLDIKQHPADTFRESFTEVVMLPVLREQLKAINPWMEPDQIEEAVTRLTASFPTNSLIENNRHVLGLVLENTSVGENRKTGREITVVVGKENAHAGDMRRMSGAARRDAAIRANDDQTIRCWSGREDLNLRPPAPHAGTLPGCATPRLC